MASTQLFQRYHALGEFLFDEAELVVLLNDFIIDMEVNFQVRKIFPLAVYESIRYMQITVPVANRDRTIGPHSVLYFGAVAVCFSCQFRYAPIITRWWFAAITAAAAANGMTVHSGSEKSALICGRGSQLKTFAGPGTMPSSLSKQCLDL